MSDEEYMERMIIRLENRIERLGQRVDFLKEIGGLPGNRKDFVDWLEDQYFEGITKRQDKFESKPQDGIDDISWDWYKMGYNSAIYEVKKMVQEDD